LDIWASREEGLVNEGESSREVVESSSRQAVESSNRKAAKAPGDAWGDFRLEG
jgi:hypothetical protein